MGDPADREVELPPVFVLTGSGSSQKACHPRGLPKDPNSSCMELTSCQEYLNKLWESSRDRRHHVTPSGVSMGPLRHGLLGEHSKESFFIPASGRVGLVQMVQTCISSR